MTDSTNKTVSSQDYERVLRQLSVSTDSRRNLDRQLREAGERNQKLVFALGKTKAEIERLRLSLSQEVSPPLNSAVVLAVSLGRMTYDDLAQGVTPAEAEEYVDVMLSGRRVRITCSPLLDITTLAPGMTVLLNDQTQAVISLGYENYGEVVTLREVLDNERVLIDLGQQTKTVARVSGAIQTQELSAGDNLTYDSRIGMVLGRVPRLEAQQLVLEEVPDITYEHIGGLNTQIEQIKDAVELPFLHPDVFRQYQLSPPHGILLYGPPGNGKTLIAKAVANSLAKRAASVHPKEAKTGYFLNIKGPELLDKYVGETERQIRDIFTAAREKAEEGNPVVVFFDEMESLFRTRGTGRSSDVETTIVPQLLTEIDGVERLDNVIVIGATNREDMIDPAVLRPGRLDIKIRIDRPDIHGAREIFSLYITEDLPLGATDQQGAQNASETVQHLINGALNQLFEDSAHNRYLHITLDNGQTLWLKRGDFLSGAVIRNIVDTAKNYAIKDELRDGTRGITQEHINRAIAAEFGGHREIPPLSEIEQVLAQRHIRENIVSVEPAY
ncbi:proteasome ATPase [Rothia sp. CCM 9418]|uniref:proteasome ATPase n=1 Tax=Rothia sp. CCM 9418 TaxID=3402661 RepID=UPI003ADC00FE